MFFARILRAAIAAMRRAPAVSLTAVITLALAIGATLAVFATLHGVLLLRFRTPILDSSSASGRSGPAVRRPPAIAG